MCDGVRYVDLGLSQVDLVYVDLGLSRVDLGLRSDTIRYVTLCVMVLDTWI